MRSMLGRGLSEDAGGLGVAAVMSMLDLGLALGYLSVALAESAFRLLTILQFSNILTCVNIEMCCQRNDSQSSLVVHMH